MVLNYITLYAHMDRVDVKVGQGYKRQSTRCNRQHRDHLQDHIVITGVDAEHSHQPNQFLPGYLLQQNAQELVKLSDQQNQSLD